MICRKWHDNYKLSLLTSWESFLSNSWYFYEIAAPIRAETSVFHIFRLFHNALFSYTCVCVFSLLLSNFCYINAYRLVVLGLKPNIFRINVEVFWQNAEINFEEKNRLLSPRHLSTHIYEVVLPWRVNKTLVMRVQILSFFCKTRRAWEWVYIL